MKVCSTATFHAAFCFDKPHPSTTARAIADGVVETVLSNQSGLAARTICPIIHGSADVLPEVARLVAAELRPLLLAVPERSLGDGLVARARRVQSIRRALDEAGFYTPLHLLGTGNPLSLTIYACCGADSFDGLEWCQTVVDHKHAQLHHFQQWDLFASQTAMGRATGLPFVQRALAHNLLFYDALLAELGVCVHEGTAQQWLRGRFPAHLVEAAENALGGDVLYATH